MQELFIKYIEETKKLHESIIRDLLNLQEINTLGISETDKNKHRNVIINKIIRELSNTDQSSR